MAVVWERSGKKMAALPKQEEVKDPEDQAPSWREFTQNTTFHGIRYVFDDATWYRKLVLIKLRLSMTYMQLSWRLLVSYTFHSENLS